MKSKPAILLTAAILSIALFVVFKPTQQSKWVSASYGELVDVSALSQSGSTIFDLLKKTSGAPDKGQLQPFLDRFSLLLDDIVTAEREGEGGGFVPVVNAFPDGVAQPAWAALFRSGAMHISHNGEGSVRVFLPIPAGSKSYDALSAYNSAYSVIRHPLAWISSKNQGGAISVEVFCYVNDYARCELRLGMRTYKFKESSFPSRYPTPLNINELGAFMSRSPELVGAKLQDGHLILVGKQTSPGVLAGHPIGLADLAVAYRACFHSGPNKPFVSLDPHRLPSKVSVNFGGYLDDTRIGAVLLEADKRFKSISTGLSPDGIADIVQTARAVAPGFSPEDERSFATENGEQGWQGTRFWFYPESVVVESDVAGSTAVILSPRFTADAERSAEDVKSMGLNMDAAKSLLSPSTASAIKQVNSDYDRLKTCFHELSELDTVGRLMGLFSWAKTSAVARSVDLDALLSVELPAFSTPREKWQLITASHLVVSPNSEKVKSGVRRYSFTPFLSQPTASLQLTKDEYGKIFPAWIKDTTGFASEPVGHLLGTKEQVRSFVQVMSQRVINGQTGSLAKSIDLLAKQIGALDEDIKKSSAAVAAAIDRERARERVYGVEPRVRYDSRLGFQVPIETEVTKLASVHNELVTRRQVLVSEHNSLVEKHNAEPRSTRTILQVGGGISARPESFSVRRVTSSPALADVDLLVRGSTTRQGYLVVATSTFSGPAPSPTRNLPQVSQRPSMSTGVGYYSTTEANVMTDHYYSFDDGVVTAVRFSSDGRQFATRLTKVSSSGDIVTYKFSRGSAGPHSRPAPLKDQPASK